MAQGARIGIVGLGTMGSALALNIAEKGFRVAVTNRTAARLTEFVQEAGALAEAVVVAETPEALVAALEPPRAVLLMVPAGAATEEQIAALRPLLSEGDVILDGGNADFHDTRRRGAALEAEGIRYLGLGVSGGKEGARSGPSLMAGGAPEVWEAVRDILEAIAARFAGVPCARLLGPDGAGHFVKTVHNGIEYADMQLIAEVYGLLAAEGRDAEAIGHVFREWNAGPLNAYLTGITASVLLARDAGTGRPVIEVIADRAGQKGTGRWTVIEAQRLGTPATVTEAAVAARAVSALAAARAEGAALFPAPDRVHGPIPTEGDLEKALLAARILALGQGFALLGAASDAFGWELDLAATAEVWRAGCIIRSALLDDVARAAREGLPHGLLALSRHFAPRISEGAQALRRTVAAAAMCGLPAPALGAALAGYEALRTERGTTALIQAQRDYFGAHGFGRVDEGGTHHGPWASRPPSS